MGDGPSTLNAVSCASKSSCGAVGGAAHDVALVVLSNGTHAVPVPKPAAPAPASATTTPAVVAIGEGNNSTGVAYEGSSHTLWFSWQTYGSSQWHPEQVAGPGTTYSAPSIGETGSSTVIGVETGPQPVVLLAGLRQIAMGRGASGGAGHDLLSPLGR